MYAEGKSEQKRKGDEKGQVDEEEKKSEENFIILRRAPGKNEIANIA